MDMKRLFGVVAVSVAALGGCYGAAEEGVGADEAATDEARTSRAWEQLVGAWAGDSGPFHGLVFNRTTDGRGHHWFAYVDTGIRCVRAPCPSEAQAEGSFTATTRTVTLGPSDPRLGVPTGVFGTYQYTLRADSLTLSQGGRVVARLHRVTSYCGEASDCAEQGLPQPRCLGAWSCTAERTCRYTCGRPGAGEGEFCGGIAAIRCADGLTCVLGGTYPDAGGTCRRSGASCATVRCASGTRCQETPEGPRCEPVPTCAATLCAVGTRCEETPDGARCVPAGPSCAAIRCASGYVCRETNGVGQCVPSGGVRCGSVTCGEGLVCCNPLRGICTRPGMFCIQ